MNLTTVGSTYFELSRETNENVFKKLSTCSSRDLEYKMMAEEEEPTASGNGA